MGHAAAWLLAARRAVEASKDAENYHDLPITSPGTSSDMSPNYPSKNDAELILYESAARVIQTYVSLGDVTMSQAPEFNQSCVAYALLVLSKYDLESRNTTTLELSLLLERLRDFYSTSLRKSAAVEFGLDRALAKLTGK